MPNLIYVSREKSKSSPHHFKAGALNVLVRVSAVMTNAPIILTQDCDMYSNDPGTPLRVLCYLSDPSLQSKIGYIQFPQRFHGIGKDDIYGSENKHVFQINPVGLDGVMDLTILAPDASSADEPFLVARHINMVQPEIPQLRPDHVVTKPIQSGAILALAHHVAGCNYENNTGWGSKMGMKYGSLLEDLYTGYRLQCEGWKSMFCNPNRPAFLGGVPIRLLDNLNQWKRWAIGLHEIAFSQYNSLTYGAKSMHILMALGYAHYSYYPFWSIPQATYACLPQLALLNGISILPKFSDTWFLLYMFLFLGAYAQDLLDFVLAGGTVHRWWCAQRMWLIRGLTCFLFSTAEYMLKSLGISTQDYSLTSKVVEDELSKRYEKGLFEFGVASPMFVPLTMAAILNLFSIIWAITRLLIGQNMEGIWLQMLLAGFVVLNSKPIYEAIALRSDAGKIATKTVVIATLFVGVLYTISSMIF